MSWLAALNLEKFLLFTLVLTRLSGLMMTAPIYGTRDIPMQVRALLSIALALLITPSQWSVEVHDPGNVLLYLVILGSELLVGLCLGLGVMVLLGGIQLAGETISRIGGLTVADVLDPTMDTSVSVFSRLMFLVTLAVFVCIGGHRAVMAGLLDTFQAIPPGTGAIPDSLVETFVALLSQSFALGVRTAVPAVTALLLATLVMGLISRTLPQLNILMLGFGLNSLLTFAVVSLTLGATAWALQAEIEPALETLLETFRASVRPQWLS